MQGGGSDHIFGRPQRGGVAPDSTNMNKGREGVKNPEIFADVLNGSPLTLEGPFKGKRKMRRIVFVESDARFLTSLVLFIGPGKGAVSVSSNVVLG